MTEDKACRDLLDNDGENRAVRCFLGIYQCGSPSVKQMKIHLEHSGFNDCWPEWVTDPKNAGHLTKGGAQDWLRYLFALEDRAAKPAVPDGCAIVPKEPTDKMTFVGQSMRYVSANSIGAIYRSMLSAAPTPPETAKE